jgi:hypothetical protein
VSDTVANIIGTDNRAIMNNAKISSVTANSALVSNIAALSASGVDANPYTNPVSINVSDSWANIKLYFAGDGATQNTKVKSFTIVG